MVFTIHGPVKISARKIPSSLGMKDRVISLIWVAAWKMLTTKPMTSALSSSGAESISVISIACCPMVRTVSGVMASNLYKFVLWANCSVACLFASRPVNLVDSQFATRLLAVPAPYGGNESSIKTLRQRADYQIPAIGQHKQHDFKG